MWKTARTAALLVSAAQAVIKTTPAMGVIASTADGCWVQAGQLKVQADYLAHIGLQKHGYEYFVVDDCWQADARDAEGVLQASKERFPLGMKDMADHVHRAGIKFGLTLGSGSKTCRGYPGSLGSEVTDAGSLWDWGVDYLRYGHCYGGNTPARDRYFEMSAALNSTEMLTEHPVNLDMYYAIDNWGDQAAASWAPAFANSWTTSPSINYDSTIKGKPQNLWQSMKFNFQNNLLTGNRAGPAHFNDAGELLVGRGLLSPTEEATHFALWSVAKAPLLISANVTSLSYASEAILKNDYLIAVNQDFLGQQAACIYNCDLSQGSVTGYQAQIEETATGGAFIVLVAVNWSDDTAVDLHYDLNANGISFYPYDTCETQDLWTGEQTTGDGAVQDYGQVPAHGHVAKKIKCLPF